MKIVNWKKAEEKFNGLTLRERIIVMMAIIVVVGGLGFFAVIKPIKKNITQLAQGMSAKEQEIATVTKEIVELQQKIQQDPDKLNESRLLDLEAALKSKDDLIEGLATSDELLNVLEKVLISSPNIELIALENVSSASLASMPAANNSNIEKQGSADTINEFGVRVEIKGRYWDLVKFLNEIEHSPVKVLWKEVVLEVEDYPLSNISFTVYTVNNAAGIG